MPPQLSVVIPCHNGAHWLPRTLDAVLSQTLANVEVVVVDDASTDATGAVLSEAAGRDSRLQHITLTESSGSPAGPRAAGAREATAPFLWFLDADDVPAPDVAQRIVDHFSDNADVGSIVLTVKFIDESEQVIAAPWQWGPWYVPTRLGLREMRSDERQVHPLAILCSACLISSTLSCRRSTYDSAGGWQTNAVQGYEDQDLAMRLALTAKMERLHEAVVGYRVHPGQYTANAASELSTREREFIARWRRLSSAPNRWQEAAQQTFALYDRRVVPRYASKAAWRHWRNREWAVAGRFVAGAARIWTESTFTAVGAALRSVPRR